MLKTNGNGDPTRRPWYRLHLSTWLVLPLGLIVAVFVVLPGEAGSYPERPSWVALGDGGAIVHGWPLPFLWRKPQGWFGEPAQAAWSLPWNLTDSVRDFRVIPLLVDLAAAAVALAVFAAIFEWRRRMRPRAFQFSLRQLLIFAMLVAIVFGWWGHQRAINREMTDRFEKLHELTESHMVPRVPLWLRIAAGDDKLAWLGFNGPDGSIELWWDLTRRQDIQYVVEQFPRETLVRIDGAISSEDAAAVSKTDRLEQIEWEWSLGGEAPSSADLTRLLTALEGHSHLRRARFKVGTESDFDDADLAKVATLPQLESLSIFAANGLTERGLAELRNCRSLKELELDYMRLTEEALNCLVDIKQLRRLNLHNGEFDNADLKSLGRLDGLEELDLSGSNLDDGGARQLRTMPGLRRLSIGFTQVTKSGVIELLDPSTDFSAHNLEQISLDPDFIDDELIAALKKLPKLRLVSLPWTVAGPLGDTSKSPNYPQLILRLQKAFPDREIVSVQMPFVTS